MALDLTLHFVIFMASSTLLSGAFIWENALVSEFVELVENFGANIDKYR